MWCSRQKLGFLCNSRPCYCFCPIMAAHMRTAFFSILLFSPQKLPIYYQQTENDVSFCTENEPLWFLVALELSAATNWVLICFHITKLLNRRLKFFTARLKKTLGSEMGKFKLYNAWYKSWISKFPIEIGKKQLLYQIISIVYQSCRYYILKHMHL